MGWWEKSRIHQALKRLIAGPGIEVDSTTPSAPVVSAKISTDASNALSFGTDDGLYVPPSAAGTVTSVGVSTGSSGVSVTGSPVTTSGTIDLDLGTLANVDDAPSDGTTYGRKDGAWEAAGGGGATDGSINISVGAQPGVAAAVLVPQVIYLTVPADYDLTGWEVFVDPAATVSVDVWYETFPTLPTVADSITATNYITTTAGSSNTGATGSWGTTAITRGNFLAISLTANDLATYVVVQLQGDKA